MFRRASLPFVLRRDYDVVKGFEVTSTREDLHGLLHLEGDRLVIQWCAAREITHVGLEVRTDRELAPVREAHVPLSGIGTARIRRVWRGWRFVDVLVLTASDLRVFETLTGDGETPGLVLEHPAQIVLRLRRSDREVALDFASELRLAVSEFLLASYDDEPHGRLLAEPDAGQEEPHASLEGEVKRHGRGEAA